jgi:hypothetical protein
MNAPARFRMSDQAAVVALVDGNSHLGPWSTARARIGHLPVETPFADVVGARLEELDGDANTHDIRAYIANTGNGSYAELSFMAKAAERRYFRVWLGTGRQEGPSGRIDATIDLVEGRFTNMGALGEGVHEVEAKIEPLDGGWFGCRVLCRFDKPPREINSLLTTADAKGTLLAGSDGAGIGLARLQVAFPQASELCRYPLAGEVRSLVDRIDVDILSFLKSEIADSPDVYWWYKRFAETGRGLSPMDRAIIRFWLERFGATRRMIDIGAGIGQTALALSLHGVSTLAVESDGKNFRLLSSLREQMALLHDLRLTERMKTKRGRYPDATVEDIDRNSVLVVQGLGATLTPEEEARLITAVAPADGIIFTERLFFKPRDTEEERAELINSFRALGFGEPEVVVDMAGSGDSYSLWRVLYMPNERPIVR